MGYASGAGITTGDGNAFLGTQSGVLNKDGEYNVALGYMAGYNNVSGDLNVFLGHKAGYNETGSNKLYIDNSNTTAPLLYGEFDNDFLRINGALNINGAYEFPTADGSINQVLKTDGSGNLSWATVYDNQDVDKFELNGSILSLSLERDGASDYTVDLSGYDNQEVDKFQLNGSILSLSLERDGASDYTVDLSGLNSTISLITDNDNDTKIQVEESADEDIIRFDISGAEQWSMVENRLQPNSTNIFIGVNSGEDLTIGTSNYCFGNSSGKNLTTGWNNVLIGNRTGALLTTGSKNVFIGNKAGATNRTGQGNIFIGNDAGEYETGSARLYIDNSNTISPLIYGDFINNIIEINGDFTVKEQNLSISSSSDMYLRMADDNGNLDRVLQRQVSSNDIYIGDIDDNDGEINFRVGGTTYAVLENDGDLKTRRIYPVSDNTYDLGGGTNRWVRVYATNGTIQTSDVRFKTNIANINYGLTELMQLRSVTYNWKSDSLGQNKIGFIAQELEQVIPEVVVVGDDSLQTRGVNYAELIPVLVKAIQEQQAIIDSHKAEIESQKADAENASKINASQEERLAELEAKLNLLLSVSTASN